MCRLLLCRAKIPGTRGGEGGDDEVVEVIEKGNATITDTITVVGMMKDIVPSGPEGLEIEKRIKGEMFLMRAGVDEPCGFGKELLGY